MKKTKKGFTLVELIVVISIIAILAAVTVPTTMIYLEKANISKELQNMDCINLVASKFVNSSNVPFDLSGTTTVEGDKFTAILADNELPYNDLGKVEVTVTSSGNNWNVSFTLKGQEYGDKADGSVLTSTLNNTFSNSQIFKGSTSVPTSTTTYVYYINKSSGVVTMGV